MQMIAYLLISFILAMLNDNFLLCGLSAPSAKQRIRDWVKRRYPPVKMAEEMRGLSDK